MKSSTTSAVGMIAVALFVSALVGAAQARPNYKPVFVELYEKELGNVDGAKRCTVCHEEGQNKSLRNNYGKAVAESLSDTKVQNTKAIEAALRETEKQPSAIAGKTFGDLIREGKLPASK